MAGEDRTRQIREGAGLDEARINQDFVELLQKFGTPLLLVVALIAGGYWFVRYQREQKRLAIDDAYLQLKNAVESRSPASLVAVARDTSKDSGAHLLANLTAADIYLQSYRTGVPVGSEVTPDGKAVAGEGGAFLTQEERSKQLDEAQRLYKQVVDDSGSGRDHALTAIAGYAGLAAVAESKGDLDTAMAHYRHAIERAEQIKLDRVAAMFETWVKDIDTLKTPPTLYEASQLVASNAPAVPITTGLQDIIARDAQGNPINLSPAEPPPGFEGGTAPVNPVPAPKPVSEPAPASPQ